MVNSGVWKLSGYCDVTVGLPDDCDDPQPITCNGVVGIEDEINVSFTEKWIEHGSDRSVYNLIHIVDNDYQREGSPTVSVQVRDDGFLYYRTSGDCHARFTR